MKKIADPFYQSSKWRAIRLLALKRDGYRCVLCKADISKPGMARVDHIVPRKYLDERGHAVGRQLELALHNLRCLCSDCDNRFDAARKGSATRKVRPTIGLDGFPSDWT